VTKSQLPSTMDKQLLASYFTFHGKIARRSGCWKPLRALITTHVWKRTMRTHINSVEYGKSVKDWAISRRLPKSAKTGHGSVSETAKASAINDGLVNLKLLKVQSGLK
jgi:hypothetical protein